MARYLDSVCKRCRREQMKLYLKGARCFSPKCPIDREAPPPGMHGTRRSKTSDTTFSSFDDRLNKAARALEQQ